MILERKPRAQIEVPRMSFYDRTLYIANKVRSLVEIPVQHRLLVVSHLGFFPHPDDRPQIDEVNAAHLVVALIIRQLQEQVEQQQDEKRKQEEMDVLVINDNSHRKVVGIRAISPHQIEIIEVNRTEFGEPKEITITDPQIESKFFQRPQEEKPHGVDFRLIITGRGKNGTEPLVVSSDGTHPYPEFTIATNHKVLFARADKSDRQPLSAIWWEDKRLEWFVKGNDWKQVVKEHLKRERDRLEEP